MRLALVVEYDGADYNGFQYQANAPSIQEELEKAIARLTGEVVRIKAAGRTDAGVHALGQVVAFDTASGHSPETFVRALNFYLPRDIAVKAAHQVRERFDPRRDALSRRYRYTLLNSPTPSPLMMRTSCHIEEPLSARRMQRAARLLVGTHDFARFAATPGGERASTVRHIYEASVRRSGDVITFEVEGNAFLPHQVRRMAGALVDVGRGKLSLEGLKTMIDGGHPQAVAHSLPPQGLCLVEVTYADFPQ
jgi:tRNA pseudouridine38-40 synthase